MATDVKTANTLKGAEWLIRESDPSETFTPEDFNEEQKDGHGDVLQFSAG